jgi:excisionase family DNA binding protein
VPTPAPLPDDARLVSPAEIAEAAGASLRTVREWIATGALPSGLYGRLRRVRLADWRRFIANRVEVV